jgi:two-component system, cell cycle sensor histidine kinase and response regulator CckA
VLGEGTQFKLFLPALDAKENMEPQVQQTPEGQGELILVVDDEAEIREVCQLALEAHNYRVLTANDGIQAIAYYIEHKHEINLALIDMMMPAMDGATTIRTLQKINPHIKIIAASGLTSSDQVVNVARLGVRTFLPKPYTAAELVQLVDRTLNTEHPAQKFPEQI